MMDKVLPEFSRIFKNVTEALDNWKKRWLPAKQSLEALHQQISAKQAEMAATPVDLASQWGYQFELWLALGERIFIRDLIQPIC